MFGTIFRAGECVRGETKQNKKGVWILAYMPSMHGMTFRAGECVENKLPYRDEKTKSAKKNE